MTHPNSLDLEAFASGDAVPGLAEHVDVCPACRDFVERVRSMMAETTPPVDEARRVVARAKRGMTRRFLAVATAIAIPVAAAAVVLLVVRSPTETSQGRITFKGGVQLAVIRERGGEQMRFTSRVPVQPGDRLMLEVSLDREQELLGAVIGDDDSYLELMPVEARGAGTHLSERAARVDASPLNATIIVGSEADVAQARKLRNFDDVTSLRVEWEAAP